MMHFRYRRSSERGLIRCTWCVVALLAVVVWGASPATAAAAVGLYEVWERQVVNTKSYSNPFDFNVIELRTTFTSPKGRTVRFVGFYDGDGKGGQTGNVWKMRFMPDEVGTWTYQYTWTDGTPGGSGSFTVTDLGRSGPLRVSKARSWYLETARGTPFHFRGYSISRVKWFASDAITGSVARFQDVISNHVKGKYNVTMLHAPGYTEWAVNNGNAQGQWWRYNGTFDFTRYNLRVWKAWDDIITSLAKHNIHIFLFSTMSQNAGKALGQEGMKKFYRYFAARNAAYGNFFGWSPTWEWHDIWSSSVVNNVMASVPPLDPWKRLLSSHDCAHHSFSSWLGFAMRQSPSRDIFMGNSRTAYWNQTDHGKQVCGPAGIASAFVNQPIVGSEDLWEYPSGRWKQPRNGREIRRGAWGSVMAGILPLYSEWTHERQGDGEGEPHVRRLYDFVYGKTKYREYTQLNSLVSKSNRQIASGKAGEEYLVYDENGGTITINLSGAGGAAFEVLWYDPISGATKNGAVVQGGASRSLASPFASDTVLLLTKATVDTKPPSAPQGLSVIEIQ